ASSEPSRISQFGTQRSNFFRRPASNRSETANKPLIHPPLGPLRKQGPLFLCQPRESTRAWLRSRRMTSADSNTLFSSGQIRRPASTGAQFVAVRGTPAASNGRLLTRRQQPGDGQSLRSRLR